MTVTVALNTENYRKTTTKNVSRSSWYQNPNPIEKNWRHFGSFR